MNKIYSENSSWWVDELTDILYFKTISEEQIENWEIASWTRMANLENYSKHPIRMYDIEYNGKKYYLLAYEDNGKYRIEKENTYEFDELCKEKNILITGINLN